MVPHNTVIAPKQEKNVIKVATKKHKDKLYFKREGISETNIFTVKETDNEIYTFFVCVRIHFKFNNMKG
jgi:hypothetical protein